MNKFLISGFSDEIHENIDNQFQHLNMLGIDYFEPRGIDGKNISELNDAEVSALKEKMCKYGIKASSIGSPIGKIKITDDFEKHMQVLKHVIKTAKTLECKHIRVFSFYIPDGDYMKYRDEVICRMKEMTAVAEAEGVILLHENEKGIYGDIASRCAEIVEKVNSSALKCVFDPANFVQCGQDTKLAYEMLSPYIKYMHIKDAKPDGTVVPAGMGAGNVEYILKSLYSNGYNGFLSLEPHLGSFVGLAALELDDKMEKLPQSGADTFTLAFNSLNKILKDVEI